VMSIVGPSKRGWEIELRGERLCYCVQATALFSGKCGHKDGAKEAREREHRDAFSLFSVAFLQPTRCSHALTNFFHLADATLEGEWGW
jgi:hypothetical protein